MKLISKLLKEVWNKLIMKGPEKQDPSNIDFSKLEEETLLEKTTKEFFNERNNKK
jgi:hypothetical protein